MLRSKFKTVIQVPVSRFHRESLAQLEKCCFQDQDGPERILTIAGELEPSLECLTDALATMSENQKLRQDANELRALVHTSQAGELSFILHRTQLYSSSSRCCHRQRR